MSSIAMQILQKLDRGLITVDEAERFLLSLKSATTPGRQLLPSRLTDNLMTPSLPTSPLLFSGNQMNLWI